MEPEEIKVPGPIDQAIDRLTTAVERYAQSQVAAAFGFKRVQEARRALVTLIWASTIAAQATGDERGGTD